MNGYDRFILLVKLKTDPYKNSLKIYQNGDVGYIDKSTITRLESIPTILKVFEK